MASSGTVQLFSGQKHQNIAQGPPHAATQLWGEPSHTYRKDSETTISSEQSEVSLFNVILFFFRARKQSDC